MLAGGQTREGAYEAYAPPAQDFFCPTRNFFSCWLHLDLTDAFSQARTRAFPRRKCLRASPVPAENRDKRAENATVSLESAPRNFFNVMWGGLCRYPPLIPAKAGIRPSQTDRYELDVWTDARLRGHDVQCAPATNVHEISCRRPCRGTCSAALWLWRGAWRSLPIRPHRRRPPCRTACRRSGRRSCL